MVDVEFISKKHRIDGWSIRKISRHLQLARFPTSKTLENFDFLAVPHLPKREVLARAEGRFFRTHATVICLGLPGTGKTHVAICIGIGAIHVGYRVRFISVVALAQEMLLAQQEYRLPRYLKAWQKVDLVFHGESYRFKECRQQHQAATSVGASTDASIGGHQ